VVRRLQDAGAEIVEVDLGDDFNSLVQTATWGIFAHETMGEISEFLRRHDIPTTFEAIYEGLKPQLRQAWGHIVLPGGAGATSAEAYQTALDVSRPEIQRRLNTAFVSHGALVILQPTTPCTAPLIEEQATVHIAGQEVSYLALANHTVSASSVGLPGISLPVGLSRGGLPIGLELDAPLVPYHLILVEFCAESVSCEGGDDDALSDPAEGCGGGPAGASEVVAIGTGCSFDDADVSESAELARDFVGGQLVEE